MRKYRRLRGVLLTCILGAFVSLVPTAWLFVSGFSPTAQAVAVAVVIELAVSAAVLGAFAPCPVCRARIGTEPGRLLPSRCGTCGAQFEEGPRQVG
jgi:ABC-type glycerol-3-phosphate transport system permease component